MGSGSSSSAKSDQPAGGNTGVSGAAAPPRNQRVRADGWQWFEINFKELELADDNAGNESHDAADSAATTGNQQDASDVAVPATTSQPSAATTAGDEAGGTASSLPAAASTGDGEAADAKVEMAEPNAVPAATSAAADEAVTEPSPAAAPSDPVPAVPSTHTEPAAPAKPVSSAIPENLPSLSVTGVKLNEIENAWAHRTEEYEQDPDGRPDLIVRRGQDFNMEINLSRRFYPERETIILRFAAKARMPRPTNGTLVSLLSNKEFEEDEWSMKIESVQDKSVKVSRAMSSLINDSGRGSTGILIGNWSGDYDEGTPPTHWNGSVAILQEYRETAQPVSYGQCWVFSGVFTTALRCLGIPARSVTNFASAHDTDDNMTIDKYVDIWGNDLKKGHDSVWNFHVWNEAWMTRPDLDSGLGGWQAVDATPQETSDGVFQCGPAPVIAVKRGIVNQGHDTRFVFAEVNADRVTWEVRRGSHNPHDPMSAAFLPISISKSSVGKNISTKCVGSDERNDVTLAYKFPEGSEEERAAVKNAVNKGMSRGVYREDGAFNDVSFTIADVDNSWIGEDFSIKITTTNSSDKDRTVFLKANIESCYYTGIALDCIKREKITFKVGPKSSVDNEITVKVDDYISKIDVEGLISVFVIASVKETGKTATRQDEVRLKIPDLDVKAEVNGPEVKLTIDLTNPLNRSLADCWFNVEASKLVKPFSVEQVNIEANDKLSRVISFKARAKGKKEVIVDFESNLLSNVTGSVVVDVKDVMDA